MRVLQLMQLMLLTLFWMFSRSNALLARLIHVLHFWYGLLSPVISFPLPALLFLLVRFVPACPALLFIATRAFALTFSATSAARRQL
jgi:hypothetical protein